MQVLKVARMYRVVYRTDCAGVLHVVYTTISNFSLLMMCTLVGAKQ